MVTVMMMVVVMMLLMMLKGVCLLQCACVIQRTVGGRFSSSTLGSED